jgi:Tfp pilus assembly protein PilN
MKAVNLIPQDARRGGVAPSLGRLGASHMVLALLLIAVGYVTFYVLTNNTISQRRAQVASLNQQVTRIQAQVARLNRYEKFEKLAQARAQTVREIASSRFDWHSTLSDLSKVVPANTTLQSLTATASPTTGTAGGATGSSGGIRGAIDAPAFELKGCTGSQDEVAQLMSRLRLINGVSRVTLAQSTKPDGGQNPGVVQSSSTQSTTGCAANGPSFDMVVFFQPMAGTLPSAGQTVSSTSTGASK